MADRQTSQAVSVTSFVGREKSGNHKWTSQEMNFQNYFSMLSHFQEILFYLGDKTLTKGDLLLNMDLISVFSDNEGTGFQIREARQNFFVHFEQNFNFREKNRSMIIFNLKIFRYFRSNFFIRLKSLE
jgi:hypothetical protein